MNKIKIPPFEGYDKGPRWEASEAQAVAFEDGATFGYVNYSTGFGWYTRTLCTSECGDDELTFHFTTAEDAVAHVNKVYLDLQARIAEYMEGMELELELEPFELPDDEKELIEAMEGMSLEEQLRFLGLLDEDDTF